jgi:predicted DCC family thiol-disulfide oxidoreductase YuxK
MKNGWTGGQYSLYRVVLATYLLIHFLHLLAWRAPFYAPLATIFLVSSGAVLSVLLAVGFHDRAATVGLCCVWACLFGRDPLLSNARILLLGWLLVAHLFVPPAPYGSWAARGRVDPGGGWRMPPALFAAAWSVLALGYIYSGYAKLVSPSWHPDTALAHVVLALELAFAPLALVPCLRPWLWGTMLLMQLSLLVLIGFADLSLGMVMLHLFTFDPSWIRPQTTKTERIFYDGHCGLCQRSVRLILAEDTTGMAFRFAPLQGETFAALPAKEREALPMSMVVQTENGTLLTRSPGVLHILRRLGGVWRLLAGVLVLMPVSWRDRLYDGVARVRHRVFTRPEETCPLMPPHLRTRFDP